MVKKHGPIPKGSGVITKRERLPGQISSDGTTAVVNKAEFDRAVENAMNGMSWIWESLAQLNGVMREINGWAILASLTESNNIRREQLKAVLFTRNSIGLDRLNEMRGLFGQLIEDCGQVDQVAGLNLAIQAHDQFRPLIDAYTTAIVNVRDNLDSGQALIRLAATDDIAGKIASMGAIVRSTGRRTGATPVIRIILDECTRLKQLHRLKTRGEVYEKLMETLAERNDVKRWLILSADKTGDDREKLLSDQSGHTQAYDLLSPFIGDRVAGADKLDEIEQNEKRRSKARTRGV